MNHVRKCTNKILCTLAVAMVIISCEPPSEGYISDEIHAREDTIFVDRGIFMTSARPNIENSTQPADWELLGVKTVGGQQTDALFEGHEIVTWTDQFNPETDTTVALAQEKIEITEEPPMLINKTSGELIFTQATKFVENDVFTVSSKFSNTKGTKTLEDYVVVKLDEFKPVEFPTEMRSRLQLGKGEGEFDIGYTSTVTGSNDPALPEILNGTHPYFSIQKISDEPSLGIDVKMIITDSHDTPLDPEKVVFYPSGSTYLANYHDNSVETTTSETSTTFSLPAPPFPQYSRSYSGSNSYLMYYLTTKDAFKVDTTAFENDNGDTDWSQYKTENGEVRNRAYIRWGIKINDTGTWEIKMRIPYTTIEE